MLRVALLRRGNLAYFGLEHGVANCWNGRTLGNTCKMISRGKKRVRRSRTGVGGRVLVSMRTGYRWYLDL